MSVNENDTMNKLQKNMLNLNSKVESVNSTAVASAMGIFSVANASAVFGAGIIDSIQGLFESAYRSLSGFIWVAASLVMLIGVIMMIINAGNPREKEKYFGMVKGAVISLFIFRLIGPIISTVSSVTDSDYSDTPWNNK